MDGRKGVLISHITPLRKRSIEAWTPKYSIYHGCMMLTVLLHLHLFLCSQTKDGAGRYGRSLPEHTGYVYVRPEVSVVTVYRRPVVVSLFLTSRQSMKFGVVIKLHLSRCTVMINPFCWPALKLPLPSPPSPPPLPSPPLPSLPSPPLPSPPSPPLPSPPFPSLPSSFSFKAFSSCSSVSFFSCCVFCTVCTFSSNCLTCVHRSLQSRLAYPPPPPTHPDLISFFRFNYSIGTENGCVTFLVGFVLLCRAGEAK